MDEVQIDDWSQRLDDLILKCDRQSTPPGDLLRELHDILATGPASICSAIRPEISRSSLQRLVDIGALESAALRLVRKCGYMLSSNGNELFVASVAVPLVGRDYSYNASSEEVALCGALALSLQACSAAG